MKYNFDFNMICNEADRTFMIYIRNPMQNYAYYKILRIKAKHIMQIYNNQTLRK